MATDEHRCTRHGCAQTGLRLIPTALWAGGILLWAGVGTAEADTSSGLLLCPGGLTSLAIAQDAAEPKAVVVRLADGSRIRGRLIEETERAYVIEADQLGRVEIPRGNVVELLDPSVALGPKESREAPPPPGILGTGVLAGWTKNIALGFTGKTGNTEALDLYSKFSGDYSDDERRWRVRAAYFYGMVESDNTKDEGFANGRRDWLFPDEKLFLWAESRVDYNAFKDYQFRVGGFGGVGYAFVDEAALKMLGRLGAGASREFGVVDETVPEALIAFEADWNVTERQNFSFINTLFPDLDSLGDFRNFTEAAYNIKVDTGRGLSLKFGIQNDYDSFTEDDSAHNDLTYFGALVLDF